MQDKNVHQTFPMPMRCSLDDTQSVSKSRCKPQAKVLPLYWPEQGGITDCHVALLPLKPIGRHPLLHLRYFTLPKSRESWPVNPRPNFLKGI